MRVKKIIFFGTILCIVLLAFTAAGADVYVKTAAHGGSDSNSGTSWENALASITKALETGGGGIIHVAAGTYNELITFPAADSTKIIGGYPSGGGDSSNPWVNATFINGNSLTGSVVTIPFNEAEAKSFDDLVLDGLIIRNGNFGAATGLGGAAVTSRSAGLTIVRCIIEENMNNSNGAGGIYVNSPVNDSISVVFKVADTIIRNNAGPQAGGIYVNTEGNCAVEFTNLLVHGNSNTGAYGCGGILVGQVGQTAASVNIVNCTIVDNTGIAAGLAFFINSTPLSIVNSIIWHPGYDDIYAQNFDDLTISYSNIEDWNEGIVVKHENPAFVGAGDYHLSAASPLIDRGTRIGAPSADLEGTIRPRGVSFDMGCYEYIPPNLPAIHITETLGAEADHNADFGIVEVGDTVDATVTISNIGEAALQNIAIAAANPVVAPFSIVNNTCTGILDAKESCTFTLRFSPTATGPFYDSFEISSNDSYNPLVSINVRGNSVDSSITHLLTVASDGPGTVNTEPDAADNVYAEGTEVYLTAETAVNYTFDGWDGNVADADEAETTIVMNENQSVTVHFVPDGDNDGVPDDAEQGPDGTDPTYDGNGDGIPDSQQACVVSGYCCNENYYITMAVAPPQKFDYAAAVGLPQTNPPPSNLQFPYGLLDFIVSGVSIVNYHEVTTVTLFLDPEGPVPNTYWKYGPEAGNCEPHWYEFLYNGYRGAQIEGHKITLHFVDCMCGDDVLGIRDGRIVDQGGPALAPSDFTPSSQIEDGGGGGGGCFISAIAAGQ
ncbi:MAG: choice-of-anchor D domain-containing protein [Syntrophales bacterium]|nr:choice-of-anchor D domain-containing protein [Syntrophales bacterium]MDY0043979.1 choice-of-anchor D domain-containing protein [Syntrophales bacterium]